MQAGKQMFCQQIKMPTYNRSKTAHWIILRRCIHCHFCWLKTLNIYVHSTCGWTSWTILVPRSWVLCRFLGLLKKMLLGSPAGAFLLKNSANWVLGQLWSTSNTTNVNKFSKWICRHRRVLSFTHVQCALKKTHCYQTTARFDSQSAKTKVAKGAYIELLQKTTHM